MWHTSAVPLFKRKLTPKKLIEKGDRFFKQKKFKKALKEYRRANELDPENKAVYDKMIASHLEDKQDWTDADFADSLTWTMKKQELDNPELKRVHARMSPEWDEVNTLIKKLLLSASEPEESEIISQIVQQGEHALYPLLEFVIGIKKIKPQ